MRHFIRLLSGHLKNMAEFEHLKEPEAQFRRRTFHVPNLMLMT